MNPTHLRHFFTPPLAFIAAAIAYTDIIVMMSIVTITTTHTMKIAIVKIQLVCVNPFVAVEVWVQPEGSKGQSDGSDDQGFRVRVRQAQP